MSSCQDLINVRIADYLAILKHNDLLLDLATYIGV